MEEAIRRRFLEDLQMSQALRKGMQPLGSLPSVQEYVLQETGPFEETPSGKGHDSLDQPPARYGLWPLWWSAEGSSEY